jgi:hypothetical protein
MKMDLGINNQEEEYTLDQVEAYLNSADIGEVHTILRGGEGR